MEVNKIENVLIEFENQEREKEREKKQMQKIIDMFNSREMPIFECCIIKKKTQKINIYKIFNITLDMTSKIINYKSNNLFIIYEKIVDTIKWFKKRINNENDQLIVDYIYREYVEIDITNHQYLKYKQYIDILIVNLEFLEEPKEYFYNSVDDLINIFNEIFKSDIKKEFDMIKLKDFLSVLESLLENINIVWSKDERQYIERITGLYNAEMLWLQVFIKHIEKITG